MYLLKMEKRTDETAVLQLNHKYEYREFEMLEPLIALIHQSAPYIISYSIYKLSPFEEEKSAGSFILKNGGTMDNKILVNSPNAGASFS